MRNNNRLYKYVPSLLLFLLFETVAVALWLAKGNLFYLLNFSYIGGCLGVGTALFAAGKRYARQFVQWAVGSYMLLYLGVLSHENMQIEGFWYYLFLGVFEAAKKYAPKVQRHISTQAGVTNYAAANMIGTTSSNF